MVGNSTALGSPLLGRPLGPRGRLLLWVGVGLSALTTAWGAHLVLSVADHQESVYEAARWVASAEDLREQLDALAQAAAESPRRDPEEFLAQDVPPAVRSELREHTLDWHAPVASGAWLVIWRERMAVLTQALAELEATGTDGGSNGLGLTPRSLEDPARTASIALGRAIPAISSELKGQAASAVAQGSWLYGLLGLLGVGAAVLSILHLRLVSQRSTLCMTLEALVENEERYRSMFEQNNALKLLINPSDGAILDANRAACEFYGAESRQLRGMTLLDLSTGDVEQARQLPVFANHLDGSCATLNQRMPDGTVRTVEVRASPIVVRGRRMIYAIIHDVTDRVRLERENQRAKSLESLALLAGGVAHDFDNFLASLIGCLQMMRTRLAADAASAPALQQAEAACQRAQSLTRQLRAYAKGDDISRKTLHLPPVLREAADFAVRGRTTTVRLDIQHDLVRVTADEGQIAQVVHNLVLNASQAMSDGGVVHVQARNEILDARGTPGLEPGPYAVISVTDQGSGISEADLERLFQPYFTTKSKGTGLGLAMSYSICRKHGGLITVDSVLGRGTTFRVYLPAERAKAEAQVALASAPAKTRVLCVVSDEDLRSRIRMSLLEGGLELALCRTVPQVRALLDPTKPFDRVLWQLPISSEQAGEDLHALRSIVAGAHIVAVASSDPAPKVPARDDAPVLVLPKAATGEQILHSLSQPRRTSASRTVRATNS